MNAHRLPGQRAGLTRGRVLTAAKDLLSEAGLEGLTMRALAEVLGVSPNALYSHFTGKDALLDEILDEVLGEIEAPSLDNAAPIASISGLLTSTYDVLLEHPDLVPLYLARQGARGANAQRLGEIMVTLLECAGVKEQRAQAARRVLVVYTIGFAAFATRPSLEPDGVQLVSPDELRTNFISGLRWLLTGARTTSRGGLTRRPSH